MFKLFLGLKGLVACNKTIASGLLVIFFNVCIRALSVEALSPEIDSGRSITLTLFFKAISAISEESVEI